jgi:DNA-binding LytR/AlgR family response regulator
MDTRVLVKNRFRETSLSCDEILYIMKELRKVTFYTEARREWAYGSIDDFSPFLDEQMYRCHYSLVVNLNHIHTFVRDGLVLTNGATLNMGCKALRCTKRAWERHILAHSAKTICKRF